MLLARAEEASTDLIAWWDGDDLEEDAQVVCNVDETVVFVDEDGVVATLGPGRHKLPEMDDLDSIAVAFVRTAPVLIEASGQVEDLDNVIVTIMAEVRIADAAKMMPLLDNLDDEESLEGWLGDELLLHAAAVAAEAMENAKDIDPTGEAMLDQTADRARTVLTEYGIEVPRVGSIRVSPQSEA